MAKTKVIEIEAKIDNAVQQLGDIKDALKEVDKTAKKSSKGLSGIKNAVTGVGAVLTGGLFKAGAVVFEKLMELFMGNQRVVDALAVGANFLQKAFNDLVDLITNVSIPSFSELKDGIMQGLIDRFNQAKEVAGLLGKAVVKLFKGDFSGAVESLKEAGKESVDVITGQDKSFEKVTTSVKNYATETLKAAKNQVDLNKQAQLAEALNAKLLLQFSNEAELQRQLRDDTNLSIEERIAANEKLGQVLDEQAEVMMANAQSQVDAARAALDLDKENLDLQIALIQAETALIDVEETVTGFRSEQLVNQNALLQEQQDLLDEADKKEEDRLAKEKAIKEQADKEEADRQKQLEQAAIDQDNATLGRLANLAGEGSRIGKAMAVADVTRQTIQGVQNAFTTAQKSPITTLFPPYPFIQAGIAAAFGAKSIQSILSNSKPQTNMASARGETTTAAPEFNVVGASPINQLAQTIGEQDQKPVKAFVVANEVSTAQSLDRNTIESATL